MAGMSELSGMTVNERLFAANLLQEWDEAAKNGDRNTMVRLLGCIELAGQAEVIADVELERAKPVLTIPDRLG
jgi:hypothetical protein